MLAQNQATAAVSTLAALDGALRWHKEEVVCLVWGLADGATGEVGGLTRCMSCRVYGDDVSHSIEQTIGMFTVPRNCLDLLAEFLQSLSV